jgi:hypothetical protein
LIKPARKNRRIALAVLTGAALFGAIATPSAQAATPSNSLAAVPSGAIPPFVNPAADLAAHIPGPEPTWVDSIFVAGQVHGGGHDFAILVHTLNFPHYDQRKLFISIADTTTGWYKNYQAVIPKDEFAWSQTRLHIEMPGLTWTGTARRMHLRATTPWGSLKTRFRRKGPVLNYSGNGLIKLLGDVNYEYAFPTMRTVGTLRAEGRTRRVSGVSWLDRQWGPVPVTDSSMRWTWMNPALSNGDQLAIWDVLDNRAQHSWVTVLRPDGSYRLASVRPLARGAGGFWTSPRPSHKTYPTRWRVRIPALRARLRVVVAGPRGQEFPDEHVEDTAIVTGSYEGKRVTGTTFVEMTGDWSAHP